LAPAAIERYGREKGEAIVKGFEKGVKEVFIKAALFGSLELAMALIFILGANMLALSDHPRR